MRLALAPEFQLGLAARGREAPGARAVDGHPAKGVVAAALTPVVLSLWA
jgi:hypothetical protein